MKKLNQNSTIQVTALPSEPPFPINIFKFSKYTGWRIISLIIFLVFTLNFCGALYFSTFEQEEIVQEEIDKKDGRGWLKKSGIWLYRKSWQDYPEETKLKENIEETISDIRFWSFVRMILSWCLVWICFDWNTAKYFIFATISISFGIVYSLLPIDAIPDFIPVGGVIDDLTLNIFGTGLGIASIMEYYKKKKQKSLVAKLVTQHPDAALNIALEDYDLTMDNSNKEISSEEIK